MARTTTTIALVAVNSSWVEKRKFCVMIPPLAQFVGDFWLGKAAKDRAENS